MSHPEWDVTIVRTETRYRTVRVRAQGPITAEIAAEDLAAEDPDFWSHPDVREGDDAEHAVEHKKID